MRHITPVILTCFISSLCQAQDGMHRTQISAATTNAILSLHQNVSQTLILPNLTVEEFINRTQSAEDLIKTLQLAEQIGGPRWIGDQICQVRLQISGPRVAEALLRIAANHPKQTPVSAQVLEERLAGWNAHIFSGVGSSTGGVIKHLQPPTQQDTWSNLTNDQQSQAVSAAKEDAVHHIIESISPVSLSNNQTIGEAMALPAVREELEQWIASRPITRLDFRDDMQVELALAVQEDDLFDALKAALNRQSEIPLPNDEAGWEQVRRDVKNKAISPVGRAALAERVPLKALSMIPRQPPDWVNRQIVAEGTAASAGSKLKTARAAEAGAAEILKAKLMQLPLTSDMTVGEAARKNPRIGDALARALSRARTHKIDYQANGGAVVYMNLNLKDVWREMASIQ